MKKRKYVKRNQRNVRFLNSNDGGEYEFVV